MEEVVLFMYILKIKIKLNSQLKNEHNQTTIKYFKKEKSPENKKQYCINDMQYFKLALENKLKGDYSLKYKSMLRFVFDKFSIP